MKQPLILYFSVYSSTKALAEEIARQTGGDLVEIVPEIPYDRDRSHYNALARLAKKEHDEDLRPQINPPCPLRTTTSSTWAIPCGGTPSR